MEVAHSVAATAGETEVGSIAIQVNHRFIMLYSRSLKTLQLCLFLFFTIDLAYSCRFAFIDS